jgi:arylsulfatase A-like enzyme
MHSALLWAVLALLAAPGAASAVEQPLGKAPDQPAARDPVRRAIEPADGASTYDLPRVEIGSETRTVLRRAPRHVLQVEHPVDIAKDLPLALAVPAAEGALPIHVEGWVSIRGPQPKGESPWEVGRLRLPIRSLWLGSPAAVAGATATLADPAPSDLPSRLGLLTVIAWPLGARPTVREVTGAFAIAPGDVLRFGYAVEEPAWAEGFAPVEFTVSALEEDGRETKLFGRRIDPATEARDRRWFDARVPLDAVAGRSVRFAFTATALPADGAKEPRSLPVFSNPEVESSAHAPSSRPNLVLVSLDTLRAKSVGAYGHSRDTTPQLDRRVAAAGALLRQVVAPVPLTAPSHMTMLTGLEPCAHGVRERDQILPPEYPTLAEILRAAGYRTAAVTEDAYVVASAGFARGFDTYVEERSDEQSSPGFGAETFETAAQWLSGSPREPFFLLVHTYQVHAPYRPPRGYRTLFPEVLFKAQPLMDDYLRDYEREIRYTDDLLASFLDVLDSRGLSQRTVLVVTSDHGETFGEAIMGAHGFNLKDSELLVPLMIRAPGTVRPGTVVELQVGLVDLTPTLLDLLGVPSSSAMQGRSFARLLGAEGPPFEERPIISGCDGNFSDSVRTSSWKYEKGSSPRFADRLYDLRADPAERRDLARRDPELLERGRRELANHREECLRWRTAHPASKAADGLFEHRPGWLVNRDEVGQKLRSLGYVE